MTITIYGIKACSTMKKAFNKLDDLNLPYEFHDYKKQGIDKAHVERWVNKLGIGKVLNKQGTTWRKLTEEQKQAAEDNVDVAIALLIENTSMIKRPIIEGVVEGIVEGVTEGVTEGSYEGKEILLCGFDDAEFTEAFA